MRISTALLAASLAFGSAGAGLAQESGTAPADETARTLADVKQDVSVMFFELQKLRRELATTGGTSVVVAGGPLDRLAEIETALSRMTGKIERLEFRIEQVATDGGTRLANLDFRICELEPDCDIANLGSMARLGGQPATVAPAPDAPTELGTDVMPPDSGALAIGEEDDFETAQAALEQGDFGQAQSLFEIFRETYPASPLEPRALLGEGIALSEQGNTRDSARRYLTVFSDYPQSDPAPEALWRLGVALHGLGSANEACVTLAEVARRYPESGFVARAEGSRADFACE